MKLQDLKRNGTEYKASGIMGHKYKFVEGNLQCRFLSGWGKTEFSLSALLDMEFSEIKKPKRYWLWDVKGDRDVIRKTSYYLDETGFDTYGTCQYIFKRLIKKHENEYIEV